MSRGVRRRPRIPREAGAGRQSWREWVPSWVSALAAVVGVVLTIVGVGAVTQRDADEADLVGTSIVIGPEGIRGEGEYRSLRPTREEILVMARPEHAEEPYTWVHVPAERDPRRVDAAAGIEDGAWEAVIPLADVTEEWRVVVGVVEAGLQGIDAVDALREVEAEGPDADVVISATDAVVVSPDE